MTVCKFDIVERTRELEPKLKDGKIFVDGDVDDSWLSVRDDFDDNDDDDNYDNDDDDEDNNDDDDGVDDVWLSVRVIDYTDDDDDDNYNDDDDGVDDGGEVDDGWLSVRVIGHRPSRPSVLPSLTCHCLLPFQLFPPSTSFPPFPNSLPFQLFLPSTIFPRCPFLLFPTHCCPLPFKLFLAHSLFFFIAFSSLSQLVKQVSQTNNKQQIKCSGSPSKDLQTSHPATPYNSIRKRIKSVSIKYLKHR